MGFTQITMEKKHEFSHENHQELQDFCSRPWPPMAPCRWRWAPWRPGHQALGWENPWEKPWENDGKSMGETRDKAYERYERAIIGAIAHFLRPK